MINSMLVKLKMLQIIIISVYLLIELANSQSSLRQISTFAGTGGQSFSGDQGPAISARFYDPRSIWGDINGDFYVSDVSNQRIRIISSTGIINTFAGNGLAGSDGDGGAPTSASFDYPYQFYGNISESVFVVAENNGNFIRQINTITNTITSIAGISGPADSTGNGGPATSAKIKNPLGVVMDNKGNLFISESSGTQVRKVDASTGIITTVAGNAANSVYSGDGGQATSAGMYIIFGLCIDIKSTLLYIAVPSQNNVRVVVLSSGRIYLVAGAQDSTLQSGKATSIQLNSPRGVWNDLYGQVFISEYDGQTVKRIDNTGMTMIIAGTSSVSGVSGDSGPPTSATLSGPYLLFVDTSGFVFVADSVNQKIRKIFDFQPTVSPSFSPFSPSSQPSNQPTSGPTGQPTALPSSSPSAQPSREPTGQPTSIPSFCPSCQPSRQPSTQPMSKPSAQPSHTPTNQPTCIPTVTPSEQPSRQPSSQPSRSPSSQPSSHPSRQPSGKPTTQPSTRPTSQPSFLPSVKPSSQPTHCPSLQPSAHPSSSLTLQPSSQPLGHPSSQPFARPSTQPTNTPLTVTCKPTHIPSIQPSLTPSHAGDTLTPTRLPTVSPSRCLPFNTHISVNYTNNVVVNFKIVLPFMFSNPVYGRELSNIAVGHATVGTNYIMNGVQSPLSNNKVNVADLMHISPAISYDFTARSISNAGDINGDTFDDLIIGAPYASTVYVLFGTKHGFVNMTEGFTIIGALQSDLTGWSVSAAGDFNNDTFADVIVGAPYAGTQSSGAVYVIYGKVAPFASIDFKTLNPSDGYVIYGAAPGDYLGVSVSGAGDVNHDGFDDIIAGALRSNAGFAGAAYVVYGSAVKPQLPLQLSVASSDRVTVLTGATYSWFGYSVSGAGDVNGDKFDDVIIGSVPRKLSLGTPVSYLVFGARNISSVKIASLTPQQGVVITGGGVVVSGVGDINGDGFDDVMVGGSDYGFDSGGGYIVTYPQSIVTHVPSTQPSHSPTTRPSKKPSVTPTQRPTSPTMHPTLMPTGPSETPTIVPTQPTSLPSGVPTVHTAVPSWIPSAKPSTLAPSVVPSTSPSTVVSTLQTTRTPTILSTIETDKPAVELTRNPSRFPVIRPTIMPTVFLKHNRTFVDVVHTVGGVIMRDEILINHITNTTSDVIFVGTVSPVQFTFVPHTNSNVTIDSFNITSDVLNFEYFTNIQSINDLQILEIATQLNNINTNKLKRLLRTQYNFNIDLCITLSYKQHIYLINTTYAQIQKSNMLFYKTPQINDDFVFDKNPEASLYIKMVGASLAGCLFLYLVYKTYTILQEKQKQNSYYKRIKPAIDFEQIRLTNETYLSFIHGDSDQSLLSSDCLSSISSEDSSNEEGCESSDEGSVGEDDDNKNSQQNLIVNNNNNINTDNYRDENNNNNTTNTDQNNLKVCVERHINNIKTTEGDSKQQEIIDLQTQTQHTVIQNTTTAVQNKHKIIDNVDSADQFNPQHHHTSQHNQKHIEKEGDSITSDHLNDFDIDSVSSGE